MNNSCNYVYKIAICFSDKGREVLERLKKASEANGCGSVECFYSGGDITLDDFTRKGFEEHFAMIFVGAAGIAVRAISPYVKDKLSDSPVIVIDDNGQFVIPILSGHAGGANKLAVIIASLLDAVPVITTSTDVNEAFCADVFAVENHLTIRNRDGIKKVSAKAIEGRNVTISIKDYPPKDKVDITIADETDAEYDLLLSPKRYVVGIGTKKGKDPRECEDFVLKILGNNGITTDDVYAVGTIDLKQDEPAIRDFCRKYRIPLITFEASVLQKAQGDFASSDFVKETVGVDNVCERAAYLASGCAKIICKKTAGEGITVAIAKKGGS